MSETQRVSGPDDTINELRSGGGERMLDALEARQMDDEDGRKTLWLRRDDVAELLRRNGWAA
jgi:hypothetical protein